MPETHSKYFFNETNASQIKEGSDVILVTDNFSTPENIGSIIRLAANVGASKVMVIGSADCRESKIKKTAGAAFGHVKIERVSGNNFAAPEGYQLVALETANGATNLYQENLPHKIALVLGNEKYGVSEKLLDLCEAAVYIPMPGAIKSMNVSHAASVCLFEWMRQKLMNT